MLRFSFCCALACSLTSFVLSAQTPSWKLWASGLPQGVYPKLAIGPNHDIFFGYLGVPGQKGIIYKASTTTGVGSFSPMPAIPVPASIQNNIKCLETNRFSEPIVGIYRSVLSEPWLFRFDNANQQWIAATTDASPALGAYSMAKGKNGDIWVGGIWSDVYRSTDDGNSYTRIYESADTNLYPCYYPSWLGNVYDGAIFGIGVDGNGRVYAGTESGGVLYSDNEGGSWQPADFYACQNTDPTLKDSSSAMKALSFSGNAGGIGFTADNKLIWNGAAMWNLGWPNTLGCADMVNHTAAPAQGIPQYLITTGQQVTKIVTAANGQVFLHSGGAAGNPAIGVYTSMDGLNWTLFNDGITGLNDNQSQGGLAVDSNLVFFATHDGKIWRYVIEESVGLAENPRSFELGNPFPNPAGGQVHIEFTLRAPAEIKMEIFNAFGKRMRPLRAQHVEAGKQSLAFDVSSLPAGVYTLQLELNGQFQQRKLLVWR